MTVMRTLLALLLLAGCRRDEPEDDASVGADAGEEDAAEVPEDRGPPPTGDVAVRVATFNVLRFFDDECQSNRCTGGGYEEVASEGELRSRAEAIASAIRGFDADVIILEEVENDRALGHVLEMIGDTYVDHHVAETGPATLDVAIISRFEILDVVSHRNAQLTRPDGSRTTFTRDFIELHLDVDRSEAIVFGAHFKSKADDDPGRREAEGRAAGEIVADVVAANPHALVVMGGDLNDVPGSSTLSALEASGVLSRVAEDIVPDDKTYRYRGNMQAIDHLFLGDTEAGSYVSRSAEVHGEPGRGLAGSDHAALVADFVLSR